MHSRIFQVSTNPINETDYIDECCYWDHWFINEVADYVANSTDRDGDIEWLMEYSKGIIISEDENGKFLIVTDKEKYFKNAFENFQEAINKVSKYTIDDFIDDGILRISSQDLDFLNDGQLQMIVQFAFKDDNYEDGYFDKTATKATGYYIKHNIL